jgi:hypothetical protein
MQACSCESRNGPHAWAAARGIAGERHRKAKTAGRERCAAGRLFSVLSVRFRCPYGAVTSLMRVFQLARAVLVFPQRKAVFLNVEKSQLLFTYSEASHTLPPHGIAAP